jgi:hypothetical protein
MKPCSLYAKSKNRESGTTSQYTISLPEVIESDPSGVCSGTFCLRSHVRPSRALTQGRIHMKK